MQRLTRGHHDFKGATFKQQVDKIKALAQGIGTTVTHSEAVELCRERMNEEVWLNDMYVVCVKRSRTGKTSGRNNPDLISLSIRRQDRKALRDWRDFQSIKNQIFGKEIEMVELFPKESRLVDTANQFHLWGFDSPDFQFPFGFNDGRLVSNVSTHGAKQRARECEVCDGLGNLSPDHILNEEIHGGAISCPYCKDGREIL